ncbi:MAG: hypothetical protein V4702_04890 [Patescibacteria group bacterium]
MRSLNTPDQFKTKSALLFMGTVGIVLAYLLLTRAFDTGSWWQYFGTVALLALSIRLLMHGFKSKK